MRLFKSKDTSINELSDILNFVENGKNPELRATLVAAYDLLKTEEQKKYFTKDGKRKDGSHGVGIIFNHSPPPKSRLELNGGDAIYLNNENYNIHEKAGRKKLQEIIRENHDGAVEISSTGQILSYRRWLVVDAEKDAVKYGLASDSQNVPCSVWGLKIPSGKKSQNFAAASRRAPDAYLMSMSEEKGHIRLFKAGRIDFSTIPQEIDMRTAIYLNPVGELYAKRKEALALEKTSEYASPPSESFKLKVSFFPQAIKGLGYIS